MADPVSLSMMGLSLAATGLKAAGSITQGKSAASGDAYQAQQAEYQAQYGQIKAAQTGAYMQESLSKTLSNITATQAATGASPESPSAAAFRNYSEFLGDRDRNNQVANIDAQVKQDQDAEAFYTQAGHRALVGGFLGAIGDVASGLSGFASANPGMFSGGGGGVKAGGYAGGPGIGMA